MVTDWRNLADHIYLTNNQNEEATYGLWLWGFFLSQLHNNEKTVRPIKLRF